jgi:hypothetical protein
MVAGGVSSGVLCRLQLPAIGRNVMTVLNNVLEQRP